MPTLTYLGDKDQPRARTGSRGFATAIGTSVMLDSNVPTEVSTELLQELETMPSFNALKKIGAITLYIEPITQQQETQAQDTQAQETDNTLKTSDVKKVK